MTMKYSFALEKYRNVVNQKLLRGETNKSGVISMKQIQVRVEDPTEVEVKDDITDRDKKQVYVEVKGNKIGLMHGS